MATHLVFDTFELHDRSDEINPLAATEAIAGLKSKLKKYKDLYALSAPQIGFKQRIIAIKFKDNVIKVYVNPVILKWDNWHLVREKDISIPDKEFINLRPGKIHIRYQEEDARPEENFLYDSVAETFDRMQNYLDGITPDDLGLEVLPEFDSASKEDQTEIIHMYLESLKKRQTLVQESIDNDKDAKELQDAIEFMEQVDTGKIQLADKSILDEK